MADKKNLCAQIDIALHNRVTEEKDRLEMTTSQYIAALLTEYYKMKDENGGINMTGSRTMAFQIPEELFQRIKTHLARETARTGVKLTQRDFVLGLIEQALAEAEASLAPQEGPESTEEAPEDSERPEDTSQADASSGPFFVFPRRGVNMIQTSEKTRFTEAEMATVRDTDLPDLLISLGYQVKRIGRYYTTQEMDSIRIKDRRTWFRYSEGIGGDAITFLQRFYSKSFPEAVEYLLTWHGRARDSPPVSTPRQTKEKEEKVPFTLPPANVDHRRVFAYLRKRGIAPQVIRGFVEAGLLYEDAQHHNCVFVGRDQSGAPVFANQRGTYDWNGSSFKGDVPGSNKDIAFRLYCSKKHDAVLVFEAPIDLMSFCTLHRKVTSNAVALCGLYEGGLRTYLRDNPHIRRIILCLDNDEHGRQATQKLREMFSAEDYEVSQQLPPQGKDWNEYLLQRNVLRERG